jgi:hypothetical protein
MPGALLVSFGGYPYTPSSLMPDNGLASLAGALAEVGVSARILDFGTVSMMRRLFPRELTETLKPAAQRLLGGAGGELDEQARGRLRELDAALGQHQQAQMHQIAREVADEVRALRPDFVAMKLWNGDGFTGSVIIAERLRSEFPSLPIYAGGPQASWWGAAIYQPDGRLHLHRARRGRAHDPAARASTPPAGRSLSEHPRHHLPRRRLHAAQDCRTPARLDMDTLPEPIYDERRLPGDARR